MVLEVIPTAPQPIPSTTTTDTVDSFCSSASPSSALEGSLPQPENDGGRKRMNKRRAADAHIRKFHDLYISTGESLGRGAFGHVKTYRNRITGQEFAVKIVDKGKYHRRSRYKVLKEIEIYHHCTGQRNILQLVEYFEEDDRFYLVFEKMEGGSLMDALDLFDHVTEDEARDVIRDVAVGLQFLHEKGIAHRDLKPENILCVGAGCLSPVKICDFDLASGVQVDTRYSSGLVTTPDLQSPVGSADYMAPEVIDVWQNRAWTYDKRCDLWSLGIIMYVLLCGYKPFYFHERCGARGCDWSHGGVCENCQDMLFDCIEKGEFYFPSREWSSVSGEAKDLIDRLLVRDPNLRYTAQDVLEHPWFCLGERQVERCCDEKRQGGPVPFDDTVEKSAEQQAEEQQQELDDYLVNLVLIERKNDSSTRMNESSHLAIQNSGRCAVGSGIGEGEFGTKLNDTARHEQRQKQGHEKGMTHESTDAFDDGIICWSEYCDNYDDDPIVIHAFPLSLHCNDMLSVGDVGKKQTCPSDEIHGTVRQQRAFCATILSTDSGNNSGR